eukprot:TRINITY_DN294_c0_g1_i7.p1 TRINITY_DN294_c0_g1~~TRINITY_DN294_c0_g1_i7.p1  ORF type:complete len:283 (-),score=21.89 TRINITY_DN294_c0_g1_i7:369-1217(-)
MIEITIIKLTWSSVRKLFPDIKERQNEEEFRRQKILKNKSWMHKQQTEPSTILSIAGGQYKGESLEGKRHGYGIWSDPANNQYEGIWENDQKSGYFIIRYSNRERFEGHFEHNKRNGECTHYYSDGSKFHGDYKNDLRHGTGMYWTQHEYYTFQKCWLRKYENGLMIKNEEIYTGEQRESHIPEIGFGTHIDANGLRYEGDHVNYKRHGKGSITYPTGEKEIGEWVHGVRQGVGMKKVNHEESVKYYFVVWKDDEVVTETESDEMNWNNFFWYDEGGFASHN